MRTASTALEIGSYINTFSDAQSLFERDTDAAHCAIDLRMAEQKRYSTEDVRLAVDFRSFGAAARMSASALGSNPLDVTPITIEPTVLPLWDVSLV